MRQGRRRSAAAVSERLPGLCKLKILDIGLTTYFPTGSEAGVPIILNDCGQWQEGQVNQL
ncbi:hypothetical protein NJ75_04504 [Novosphingobium subterraneum]|uniref:Uncharacterized protein n=1 Tax=Novosphingobium subterraneum TaxID=48936 RepID=A0A0B8Z6B3_9SPHN|nr:hypothetical protein NJ75_04504 [Novosphingobium subterraneum]